MDVSAKMQTVPSLVGTGTAVAAAATGLIFGQLVDSTSHSSDPVRPASNKRKTTSDKEPAHLGSAPLSRPGTSPASQAPAQDDRPFNTLPHQFALPLAAGTTTTTTAANPRHPRPLSTQFAQTPSASHSRRHSFIRPGDFSAATIAEDQRDSISSNGSWMRRLSIRPLSQHGSPRSSVGPDSPSLTFSHGSSAPILSPGPAPPLPPNKLVKRAPSTHGSQDQPGVVTRRRSRSHLPTLRRPATSHQRTANLQQLDQNTLLPSPIEEPKYSLDQIAPPREFLPPPPPPPPPEPLPKPLKPAFGWTSFFHSRTIKLSGRGIAARASDGSPGRLQTLKRICVNGDSTRPVYLIRPGALSSGAEARLEDTRAAEVDHAVTPTEKAAPTPEETPAKRARRSISMTFSSPGNWITRAGSIRRPKRGPETKGGGKRHVSAPLATQTADHEDITMADDTQTFAGQRGDADHPEVPQTRKRNSSSPLPPLTRLSSFNVDLSRLGATATTTATASTQPARPNQPSGSSQASSATQQRKAHTERSSTMNSSDFDARDFALVDDDDTDFKSDTLYDSVRTVASVASARVRTVDTSLESMFDETPPSSAGNSKTKRLSIQEILGASWEGNNKIMEEDEGAPTPVHDTQMLDDADYSSRGMARVARFTFGPGTQNYCLPSKDFSRLSIDDELDDEDWTKDYDDIPLSNHLSPPSKGSSLNSQGVSPNVRMALAAISGNGSPEIQETVDRPLSNLFDWSETSAHDKEDSPRPKTACGKQDMDCRGGRSAIRKGPTAAHVRSQSVPVVHDQPDGAMPTTTKFGTWGLSSKTVSEDWGDDFDLDPAGATGGGSVDRPFVMVVPASIQATQPSVKAHSGQIRELSLLVNDLKRLCRHGREMDILEGPQSGLWKEAEGIIALASPDEDAMEGVEEPASDAAFPSDPGDRFIDGGFDVSVPAKSEESRGGTDAGDQTGRRDRQNPRRQSVFSPEDDIFGGGWPMPDDATMPEPPRTPVLAATRPGEDVTGVVRSVVEAMQHRSVSTPTPGSDGKLHFDTTSLKTLVKRAGDLRDVLSDMIRRADPIAQSPARPPRHESSPAFTRVFNDPSASPPKRLPHSRSSNSVLSRQSLEASPTSSMGQRMQLMTVS